MSNLQVIHEQELLGRKFKVYGNKEEPLFLAKEVAEWIEHSQPVKMLQGVDEEEKIKVNNFHVAGRAGGRGVWFITEDGLYEVLMQSRKPIAKQFKKQVKHILKSIRKDGGYINTSEEDDEQAIMAKALLLAQKTIDSKTKELEEAKSTIEEQSPKVELYDKFLDTDGSMNVSSVLATIREQGYKPKTNRLGYTSVALRSTQQLNKFLNSQGIQFKRGFSPYWLPTKEYNWLLDEGFAVVRHHINGDKQVPQLRWTPKGVEFIIDLLVYAGEVYENDQRKRA
ncbi:phage antirepressor KilAC domain-containing protein [Virgibacillus halodenitrificans]|uniref:Phage antirepressor KilAC domain-containing protein n=1 Tax=Virgibacillus halodenitrificans TaxID=1482 RepID=A0ABR7VSD3_VIRHA|nr:phage antirepressor KilAC domain-containing protein [Virgibacillus halodenitrificans]MBD1224802.1 phage antirepressor KilAC domain-containing protein [Virgibacillus halodenitrificans]